MLVAIQETILALETIDMGSAPRQRTEAYRIAHQTVLDATQRRFGAASTYSPQTWPI